MKRNAYGRDRYPQSFTDGRLAREVEEAAARATNRAENEALRLQHRAKIEEERRKKRDESEKAYEADLTAAHKEQERTRWLIDHPDQNDAAFEKIWPLLLQNLKEQEKQQRMEALMARFRAEADYEDGGSAGVPIKRSFDQIRSAANEAPQRPAQRVPTRGHSGSSDPGL